VTPSAPASSSWVTRNARLGTGSVRVCLLLGNTQQRARHPVGDAIEDGLMQQDGVAPQPPPQHH